jgi:DNA-binding MurR/RpiR family transcriptional regulator
VNTAAENDFFSRLSRIQQELSPRMARLSAYVAQNYIKVAIMSTREVAKEANVGQTTVVRLTGALGYKSFDELRSGIQNRVNVNLNGIERLKSIPADSQSPLSLLQRTIEQQTESLRGLAQTFVEADFMDFCRRVIRARRLIAIGLRYTAPLADYFRYSLDKLRPGVESWTFSDSTVYDRLRLLDPKRDALVVVALPRYPRELLEMIRYAHARGIPIMAITDSP